MSRHAHSTPLTARVATRAAALVALAIAAMLGAHAAAWRAFGAGAWLLDAICAATIAGASALAAARWARRMVAEPLAAIAHDAARVADGDARHAIQVDPAAPREVADVAAAVARTASSVRDEQARRVRVEKLATVGRMAAGIAHEVGNPLASIVSYVHVLRMRVGSASGAAAALDGMEREAERIDRIVRGLLDFARTRRLTPSAVDVNEIVADVVRLLQDQGVLRRLHVSVQLDDAAPRVFAERHEVEQMLVNLLLNAADAVSPPGRVVVTTRRAPVEALREPGVRRAGDAESLAMPRAPNSRIAQWLRGEPRAPRSVVQIVVADSGPGIDDADLERVFDPFFTTKEPGKGTGLGLAIVASTVDRLGGAVWVQRAREGGAAFVALLPVAEGPPVGLPAIGASAEQLPLPLDPPPRDATRRLEQSDPRARAAS